MNKKIGIVTVLYNSEKVLQEFFATLNFQTYQNFILYVIDNKSLDNSLELSKQLTDSVRFSTKIIENNENSGVAKGNNIGIKAAIEDKCEYILLSNNDVALKENTIELLVRGLVETNSSMAVPKILFYNTNIIWAAGGKYNYFSGGTNHISIGEEDDGQRDYITTIKYAPTCFMLIKKEVFDNIGYMDEKYFVYFDDTDFLYRAYKAKKKLVYIPESILFHNESTCTGGFISDFTIYYLYRNLIYFSRKHYSIFHQTIVYFYNIMHFILFKFWKFNRNQCKLLFKAYLDGFKLSKK